jgi:putative transposase
MQTPVTTEYEDTINAEFLPSESLWAVVEPLLPLRPTHRLVGRKPKPDKQMFYAIYYVLRTGMQWNALPRCLGAASTVHDRFQQWVKAGVFYKLWHHGLIELDIEGQLDWEFQSIDGCQTKAPLGGQATGANPTDRGKQGVKRHLLTDTHGLPIGLVVTGANRHDKTQVENVLETMPLLPPMPTEEYPQHFCADKGYDYNDIRSVVGFWQYENHTKSRGQEAKACRIPGYRARRWVCERTHSWMNRFRRLLIRWEKKVDNYQAMLHLACAFMVWKNSLIFG